MRVAFLLSALGAGGAERVVSLIASAAVERGWTVTIITFDHPGDPVFHPFDPRIRLLRLALPAGGAGAGALPAVLRRLLALGKIFRSGQFDLLLSFLTKINVLALVAARGSGLPVIVSERNNPLRQGASRLWTMALRRLYPWADAIVMQTERSRICLPVAERGRALVIPNPIAPPPPARGEGKGHRTIVAAGRLTEQKGFDLLIDAFARVAGESPDWTLVIWGEGPARPALERQVAALGLCGRVLLPGTSAPGEWTAGTDMFVLSSRFEGFPNVLAEAMGAGLAVIAFDCDFGPADIVAPEVDGLLVPAEDVTALAEAMRRVMRDPDLRIRLGATAAWRIHRFDASHIAEKWLAVAENLKRTGRPAPVRGARHPAIRTETRE